MREIKFRAKFEGESEWQYYTLGDLVGGEASYQSQDKRFDAKTWSEYTGLKDKNGREIYEGDIVQYDQWNRQEVVFWEGCFCHMRDDGNGHIFNPKHVEVIGNIYENPELLPSKGKE